MWCALSCQRPFSGSLSRRLTSGYAMKDPKMDRERPRLSWSWLMSLIDEIRAHYDALTPYYSLFWREHIHHGFWKNGENTREAQENLIRVLSDFSGVKWHDRVLDVGCGIGGSSFQ